MSKNESIRDSIRELTKGAVTYSIACEVLEVTGDKCDCQPLNGNADLIDVKLQASTTTGILITPAVGSTVIVTLTGNGNGFVSMFSEVESVELNGSNYDGLVRVADLTTKLNNLENKVNAIIAAYNAHVHVETGASTATTVTLVAGTLTPTAQTEIENTTILHGNG